MGVRRMEGLRGAALLDVDRNRRSDNIAAMLGLMQRMNMSSAKASDDAGFPCCSMAQQLRSGVRTWTADLDAPDRRGKTLLQYASFMGHEECLQTLLGAGANPNAQNPTGMTALHFAAASVVGEKRIKSCVAELSQNGADASIKRRLGNLPWTVSR